MAWVSGGPVSTPTEYCVSIRLIRHNGYIILHWVSGRPLRTPTEYCVSVCLIRHNGYTILHWVSGGPVSTPTEYCVSVRLIRHNGYTILNWVSGGPVSTPTEYCVRIHLIRLHGHTIFDHSNIGYPIHCLLVIGHVGYRYCILVGRCVGYVHYFRSGGRPLAHLKQYNVTILSTLPSDILTEWAQLPRRRRRQWKPHPRRGSMAVSQHHAITTQT